MENTKHIRLRRWILLLLFCAAAAVFGRYDLEISLAFADPADPLARFLEVFGECTTPLLGLFCFGVLFHALSRGKGPALLWRVVCFLGGGGMAAYLFLTLPEYWGSSLGLVPVLAASAASVAAVLWLCGRIPALWCRRYLRAVVICLVSLLLGMTVVEILKNSFGQVRFREMAPPYAAYTPWFIPNGPTGSKSFPSGHTAHAALLSSLLAFCDDPKHRKKERLFSLLVLLWTVCMAVSRVRIGAHFASDVLFGGTIAALIAFFVRRKVKKHWKYQ